MVRRWVVWVGLVVFLMKGGGGVAAQGGGWSVPEVVAQTPADSWFPDLVVDPWGRVHVTWCESTSLVEGVREQVFYVRRDEGGWTEPNDIVAPQWFIHRHALEVLPDGELILTYLWDLVGGQALFFAHAPADQAWSAAAWKGQRLIGTSNGAYLNDLAVDREGRIHVVFDDRGDPSQDVCVAGCGDVYYRRSDDRGMTWSLPVHVSDTRVGSSPVQIVLDPAGGVHVTWDEGWDRLSGQGVPVYTVYRRSVDGGLSWSEPLEVRYPYTGTTQLTAAGDGRGGVMLVWRHIEMDAIYYQWSSDGRSWSEPGVLPGVLATPWIGRLARFDNYDMATDSAGRIHLLVTARTDPEWNAPVGVYHLVWDGGRWSWPVRVYLGRGIPQAPRLVVAEGNRLHAVWFVRDDPVAGNMEVWYSDRVVDAPRVEVTPAPSPTATPTVTPLPLPTVSYHGSTVVVGVDRGGLPEGLYSEGDDLVRLLLTLVPVGGVVLLVVMVRVGWRRRG